MTAPVRIVVADDHPLFREGLRAIIDAADDLELVVAVEDGTAAVTAATAGDVDVAVLDIRMPGLDGVAAARRITEQAPGVRVLMLTMFQDDASVFAALRAGARGYVLKDSGRDELLRAIRAVASGEAIFSPAVATRVLDFFGTRSPRSAEQALPMLTARELEVLELIGKGATNAAIAARLDLSRKTVSNYVASILTKLQVADRAAAAERLRREHRFG
jgi:DNA-binding NarL/FixJ family response regulator